MLNFLMRDKQAHQQVMLFVFMRLASNRAMRPLREWWDESSSKLGSSDFQCMSRNAPGSLLGPEMGVCR